MYRYRDHAPTTQHSRLAAMRVLEKGKLGKLTKIRGYVYHGRYNVWHTAVMLHGENGTARFEGFAWGYGGTGPAGLTELLRNLKVSNEQLLEARNSPWEGWNGPARTVWELTL